jgi:hypothetical protein
MLTVFGSDIKSQKSKRAAIIPYIFIYDPHNYVKSSTSLLFLVGVHAQTGEITDFGGGVKDSESDLMGAYREFHEETRGIFKDKISIELLETCVTLNKPKSTKEIGSLKTKVFYEGMSAIFVPIDANYILTAPNLFLNMESEDKEISKIMWINEKDFSALLSGKIIGGNKMWKILQNFYKEGYTSEFLETLYVRSIWDGNFSQREPNIFRNMAE